MFDELIRISDEIRDGLQESLAEGISRSLVQGALVEVDWYWYLSAIRTQFRSFWWPYDDYSHATISLEERAAFGVQRYTTFEPLKLDWSYRPFDWPQYAKAKGYTTRGGENPQPVIIRVLLRDPAEFRRSPFWEAAGVSPPTLGAERRLRASLPRSFRDYPIVYETRPSALAASAVEGVGARPHSGGAGAMFHDLCGLSIGRAEPNTAGTAGGLLLDPRSDRHYVVSCAHVLGPVGTDVYCPGPYEGKGGRHAGVVRFSAISPPKEQGQACSLDVDPYAGRLDVAVAELHGDAPLALGKPHKLRRIEQMHSFQPVTYVGKVHGEMRVQLNGLTIWLEILTPFFGDGWPEGLRCFGRIFELAGRKGDAGPIATEGDSGAWIVDEAGGLSSWNGILIGYQGTRAYGCFAEHVMNALPSANFPEGLVMPT